MHVFIIYNISTFSVIGQTESNQKVFKIFESNFDREQNLDNVYLENKFQGEKMVREAIGKRSSCHDILCGEFGW